MGYRLIVAICTLVFVCSCAAFDTDEDHVEGFGPGKDTPDHAEVMQWGPLSGYYEGAKLLSSNSCKSISDEVGVESKFTLEVEQSATNLAIKFDDNTEAKGTLAKDAANFMKKDGDAKQMYYLTFTDETIEGDCDVIEPDEEGQYGEPCATYTISMEKGEKPAADEKVEEEEVAEEESEE